ncbi:MAG: hypothetical protein AAFQ87_13270, partial [Bacteroidota bacterium]
LRKAYPWHLLTANAIVLGGLLSMAWFGAGNGPSQKVSDPVKTCAGFSAELPVPPPHPEIPAPKVSFPDKLDSETPKEIPTLPKDWLLPEVDQWGDTPEVICDCDMEKTTDWILDAKTVMAPDPIENPDVEAQPLNLEEINKGIDIPLYARDYGFRNRVVIRVLIDEKGNYQGHRGVQGHPSMVYAVSQQIRFLRCRPALYQGRSVASWIYIPYNFSFLD